MSELYFRLGEMKGFTAIDLADKKEGYANPIRELLQNSLDASHDANNSECNINVYIETIRKNDIPHIKEYEKILEKAVETAKHQGSYNANSEQRVAAIQTALREENQTVLVFSDNGAGMKKEQMEAILTGGVSIKGNEGSGGSFGVGNLSSYSLSSLCYVLYATKYKDENGNTKTLFTGSPILAGHKDGEKQRGNRGRIVKKIPVNEANPNFEYPEVVPDFIKGKMENLDKGTIVVILGLSEKWDENAEYAIVSNFFHAIVYDSLKINIHRNNRTKSITDDKVENLIAQHKENKRARGENILSGEAVYQAWRTIIEKDTQNQIKLSNGEKVEVYIKSDRQYNSAIVLIRSGMVIARHDSMLSTHMDRLRKNTDFEPFTAVIDVDKDNAPKLFSLIKNAEGPYHNKLQTKILSGEDERLLKQLLKELSEEIEKKLEKIDRKAFDLPLFEVPDKAEIQASGGNKSSGQSERAKEKSMPPNPPKPKEPKESESGDDKKRDKPIVISRNMDAKNSVRYIDEDDKWQVRLRVVPKNKENAEDEVWLSMCLAEDSDNDETKVYLDFRTLTINGEAIEIPESIQIEEEGELVEVPANKSQINLGKLDQSTRYDLIAEVEKTERHRKEYESCPIADSRVEKEKKKRG